MSKLRLLSKVLAVSAASIGFFSVASQAQAANLVPQREGEVKLTDISCLSPSLIGCIDTSNQKIGYKVTSLLYDSKFALSRLFVDTRATPNNYSQFGINFTASDIGTNPNLTQLWLRPVAYTGSTQTRTTNNNQTIRVNAPPGATIGTVVSPPTVTETTNTTSNGTHITTKNTVIVTTVTRRVNNRLVQDITTRTTTQTTTVTPTRPAENGQLEVGRFKFEFNKAVSGLKFDFFDVEDSFKTGILSYTNSQGQTFNINELLAAGPDGGVQSLILKDVKSFVVQLGNPGKNYGNPSSNFTTGDGANLQLETVPEPASMVGLGAVAMLGLMARKHRKNEAA